MHIIWSIIIGFVVGLIARMMMPGNNPHGFFITSLLGIGGSVLATYLGELAHFYNEGEPAGFLMSIVGAMVILFAYHHLSKRTVTS